MKLNSTQTIRHIKFLLINPKFKELELEGALTQSIQSFSNICPITLLKGMIYLKVEA